MSHPAYESPFLRPPFRDAMFFLPEDCDHPTSFCSVKKRFFPTFLDDKKNSDFFAMLYLEKLYLEAGN